MLSRVLLAASLVAQLSPGADLDKLHQSFLQPPDDARIMMRWWWFGAAVEKPELTRELHVMKDAGIGGVEIQPVYPLALNDPAAGIENRTYGSKAFLDAVANANRTARSLGLRVDITLGSGWPYGGPDTSVSRAAGQLRIERVPVPEGTRSLPLPALENGEQLIAALLGGRQVTSFPNGRIEIDEGLSGPDALELFISGRTGQQVKRAAVGAEGFVLDHYDPAAIRQHLEAVAGPLLKAFGDQPPQSVFSDSLEVYLSDWTPDFLGEFKRLRGYDLTPYLPALADALRPESFAVRHDWAKTLTELAEANYLTPLREWAHAHQTLFRSQTYGEPPVMLSSNALVDLPEGEHGPSWRRFSAARWASSASHLYGKPVTSTETWTWLHSPAFRATPLDMKAEADRHFVEGINQLVGHGWPYSPPSAGEPGWRFYAAAAFNEHNPWFGVMPDIARYLQRISFLLRQGQPANDVAIYVPTDDAWAHLQPGKVALDEMADTLIGPSLVPAVLNAGYNFDFIDDPAIAKVGIPYKILVLPGVERMPLETLRNLAQYVAKGGHVIAVHSLPSLAPGLAETSQTAEIVKLARTFGPAVEEGRLPQSLRALLASDFATSPQDAPAIGFVHRKLAAGEIYFVANMSNRPVDTEASIRVSHLRPEYWNAFTGEKARAEFSSQLDRTRLSLRLAPYESRVIVFSADAPEAATSAQAAPASIDLTSDWQVTFTGLHRSLQMPRLRSWSEDETLRFYSGAAAYHKQIDLSADFLRGKRIVLDFGPGTAVDPGAGQPAGMRALLEGPVREAAVVTINQKRAGSVWCPPYELDITPVVTAGPNALDITVGNTAMNEMAGRALPDYRLLNLRYGERFVPQGVADVKPLPSGLLGAVHLVARSR